MQRLLLDARRPRRGSPPGARSRPPRPRSRKRKLFMFLSSVLVPSPSVPTGRSETFASARRLPSSMFTSETPSWRMVVRSSCSHSRAVAASCRSGSVTISTSGVPPRLKSTRDEPESWMRPLADSWTSLAASSSRCARWMRTSPRRPFTARGRVELADLVRLRIVGIEVVLAVKDRPRGDLAAERQADLDRVARPPARWSTGASRGARGRSGTCGRLARRRTTARTRRTSWCGWRAGRGSPGR